MDKKKYNNIDAVMKELDKKAETDAKKNEWKIPLRREQDGSIYAWKCSDCGGKWKVYQKICHYNPDCKYLK